MACLPVPIFKVTLAAVGPGVGAVRAEAHQAMSVTGTLPPTMGRVIVMPEKKVVCNQRTEHSNVCLNHNITR